VNVTNRQITVCDRSDQSFAVANRQHADIELFHFFGGLANGSVRANDFGVFGENVAD